ncbi:unnamed protein product, partial [Ranitomeya imitator]
IMNKGRIMKVGSQRREAGQTLVTMLLQITEEFIPSFRILAYYTVTTGAGWEIVADSIWIDVADTCMGTLVVTGHKDEDNAIQQPEGSMTLKLQADHNAAVGLVAVDKGVYVINNKLKISQKKVKSRDGKFFKVATFCFDDSFAHSWHSLDELQEVVTGNGLPTILKEFPEMLSTWHTCEVKTIPGDYLLKLIKRMPRVCKAVIKAKGGYFEEPRI